MKIKILFTILLFATSLIYSQDYRYTNNVFTSTVKTSDIVYGNAPFINTITSFNESSTTNSDLVMDIYSPLGDTETQRPAIIFAHSGGFINGSRNNDDMVDFCEFLAKKGYITATIDYRKGMYLIDNNVPLHGTRAVYRGLQDGRTAVRFLRANAATYGIDPDKVYFAGSSAGAFIALHAIYMNDTEKPTDANASSYTSLLFPYNAPDLGPIDIGNNLTFNGKPDAVISLWGAIQSPDLVTATDTTPVLLSHGIADGTVPFDIGSPFGYPLLPTVSGSKQVNDKLDVLGFTNKETYFVAGEDHEFYGASNGAWITPPNAYWETIFDMSTNFLWNQHKPTVNYTDSSSGLSVDFSDTSIGALSWLWDFGDGNTSTLQNPTHVYATSGTYDVKLYIENDIKSWNETTKSLTYASLAIADEYSLNFSLYPNPTNGVLNITSKTPIDRIEIYSVLGKQVLNTTTNLDRIDISNLGTGIYIIKAHSNNELGIKRIIKK